MAEHSVHVAGVGGDGVGVRVAAEYGAGVRLHHGVDVHIDHPGLGVGELGHLVGVLDRGQPGAEVDDLLDARLADEEVDDPADEGPVAPHEVDDLGHRVLGKRATERSEEKFSWPPSRASCTRATLGRSGSTPGGAHSCSPLRLIRAPSAIRDADRIQSRGAHAPAGVRLSGESVHAVGLPAGTTACAGGSRFDSSRLSRGASGRSTNRCTR